MPKLQTSQCGNDNHNLIVSSRLPFVSFALMAWIWILVVAVTVTVTNSAPQKPQVDFTKYEYLTLKGSGYKKEADKNVRVLSQSDTEVVLSWDYPANVTDSKYNIQLDPVNDKSGKVSRNFTIEDNRFTLTGLEPGESYQVRVSSDLFLTPLETNFTAKPNPPERFVVWFRNETALLIYWQPPSGTFDKYKAEISPREGTESTLLVSNEGYQKGELTPGFYSLTPGRAYNISVMTISGNQESSPLVKEYRTIPLKPENVTVTIVELKDRPSSITVEWIPPPEHQGDYDGFNVYINHPGSKPMQKFVSRTKPSRARLTDPSLKAGKTYEVIVKTVSGKVSSAPISHNFTFIPFQQFQ